MLIVMDALRAVATTKQKEGESLQDFTKRFKVAKDVLETHLGSPIILTKFITILNGYVSESEKSSAYAYLEQCDKRKYGTMLNGSSTQYSLGNDQYPKSIAKATNVLSNHKFDVFITATIIVQVREALLPTMQKSQRRPSHSPSLKENVTVAGRRIICLQTVLIKQGQNQSGT
jgi:hypothetical protein